MLFYNTKTKTPGFTLDTIRALNPNVSINDLCTSFKEYSGYTETDRPTYNELYQTLEEDLPVDGKQVWKKVNIEFTKENLDKITTIVKEKISQYRRDFEESGVEYGSGIIVGSTIEDQNRLTSMVTASGFTGITEVDFNASNQWLKVSIDEIKKISSLLAHHVLICYAEERRLHEMVDSFVDDGIPKIADFDYKKEWSIKKSTAKDSMTEIEENRPAASA